MFRDENISLTAHFYHRLIWIFVESLKNISGGIICYCKKFSVFNIWAGSTLCFEIVQELLIKIQSAIFFCTVNEIRFSLSDLQFFTNDVA